MIYTFQFFMYTFLFYILFAKNIKLPTNHKNFKFIFYLKHPQFYKNLNLHEGNLSSNVVTFIEWIDHSLFLA